MVTHILSYLLFASVVFFFEVIFPIGLLGLAALALYGLAIFKAWSYFGIAGAAATLIVGLALAFFTAYWELRVLPRKSFASGLIQKRRAQLTAATAELKGQEGRVVSELKPFGEVEIAGKTYAVQSNAGNIPVGATIRVVDVGLLGVKVERV